MTSTAAPTASLYVFHCRSHRDQPPANTANLPQQVPSPDESQANDTIACVAACDQGNGSAADTQAYAQCRDNCIAEHFFTSGGTPGQTGSPNSGASGTGASAKPTGTGTNTASGSNSATKTGGSAGATDVPGAAQALVTGSSPLGLFALLAAVFAL